MILYKTGRALTVATSFACVYLAAGFDRAHAAQVRMPDAFTPVVVSRIGPTPSAFPGTDGLYHLVYELELTNTKPAPATLKKIEVIDASHPARVLATYTGKALLDSLRTLQPLPAESPVIPLNSSRLLFVELAFKPGEVPRAVTQRLSILGAANPAPSAPPTALEYTAGKIVLGQSPLPVIGPPLSGSGWVAINGCCNSLIIHRGSFLGVNGGFFDGQRFAIDYMRLNKRGELVRGNPDNVENYVGYGAKVLAVANGTVVSMLNTLDDQPPGKLPNPADVTLETVDGNHVVLDIGHGLYAFYAHLKKGSVTVHVGEHVKRGMVIGLLGNSGNTSAPHLHFHIMNGSSVLGSSGMPYVIDHFDLAGQVDINQFDESSGLDGQWGKRFDKPISDHDRFPLNLNIIDFPSH